MQKQYENNGGGFHGETTLVLQQQARNLEERLEESYRSQHSLENLIEEYEVTLQRIGENLKQNNKKYHEL